MVSLFEQAIQRVGEAARLQNSRQLTNAKLNPLIENQIERRNTFSRSSQIVIVADYLPGTIAKGMFFIP